MSTNSQDTVDTGDYIKELRNQLVVEQFKKLLGTISPKCFNLCVTKPGLKLSGSETDCIETCAEMYQQTVVLVTNSYMSQLKKQQIQFELDYQKSQ
jgi:import inner membrane translocase subunit TIM13